MTTAKRAELYNLIQFIDMSYRDKDINERYRDYKKESFDSPTRCIKNARRSGTPASKRVFYPFRINIL